MTGSAKRAAEFVAVVKQVLATVPPPRLGPGTDVEAVAAKLVERIIAAYPPPKRGLTHVWNAGAGVFGHVVGTADDFRRAAAFLKTIPPNVTFAPLSIP
jgi:hypothetical protein